MRILLVEDNPLDRMFVTQSLRQLDGFRYELRECGTFKEGRAALACEMFDVILLDLWLPDSEGIETCQQMIAAAENVPIVVMTASDDRALATEALRCGAQDYLVKGVFPGAAIARVLQYAIDRHQFRRELSHQDQTFREVMSHVPAVVWTTNDELKITSAFGAGLQRLKVGRADIVGQSVAEYFGMTAEAEGAVKAHQRALAGQSISFEGEWLGRMFEVKVDPLHRSEREVSGTVGVALDVTERRVLDRDINFARLVQESLLPAEHPRLDGFDVYGASFPSKQTSGDWFDYLQFQDGSWGLVVGDVCGKGFGPAILSATMAAYLEVLAETHSCLREILGFCNHMVCKRSSDSQFAVLSLAQLRPGNRKLTYAGAGEGMLIVNRNGQLKRSIASSGVPIGLVDNTDYGVPSEVDLECGDILLLLTDGFREASNPAGELFGNSGIISTIAKHSLETAVDLFKSLRRAARKFAEGAQQRDDMTGIIVKVLDA